MKKQFSPLLFLLICGTLFSFSACRAENARPPAILFAEETSAAPDAEPPSVQSKLGIVVQTTDIEKAEIQSELQSLGELCRETYLNAARVPSKYANSADDLSRADIDRMEDLLAGAGQCVVNTDALYPDHLENPEMLRQFWNQVKENRDADIAVWNVDSTGDLYCTSFRRQNGMDCCLRAIGAWDSSGNLSLVFMEKKEIQYWELTPHGFIYQDIYPDRHWTAANLLRLEPVDHDLYDLTRKYINPIGYQDVNLFLLDWSGNDFGNVSFNDLLSNLYRQETGDFLYARDFPYSETPYFHSIIPAQLFESVVYPHFEISLEDFRTRASYDAESDTYPWQDVNGGNITYYPDLIPEVTKVTENPDGTLTLLVNVMCPDNHTDRLFEHEVTISVDPDGAFRYLSNRITYRSNLELPSAAPRIAPVAGR